ncbi:MAG: hypothetical protein GVY36_05010 [Verrucomicrobia bacterium]|jgi:hypothetical protein|nr:hypothetical protein [Verrucomicrobiota bacterium]
MQPFNLNLLKELHAILLDSVRGRDKARGKFRSSQNLIGAPGDTMETAKFVPPAPEDVMPALDNWERYYHADESDPLVQLAVTHSQFAVPLLDKIFEQPVFTSSRLNWDGDDAPSRGMLATLLRTLTNEGMLKVLRQGGGRRPTTLALAELINLCEGKKIF